MLMNGPSLVRLRRIVRSPLVWARHRPLEPDVAVLCHYPKSGSTWLRFLLAGLHVDSPDRLDFSMVRQLIPPAGVVGVPTAGPRIAHTHDAPGPSLGRRPLIYLVRDPRDVCASYFAYAQGRGYGEGDFGLHLERFLRGGLDNYGSWSGHVLRAKRRSLRQPVQWVRYEDLQANPVAGLSLLVSFLDLQVSEETVSKAIQAASRENMRAKEATLPKKLDGASFVRDVSARGWKDLADDDDESRLLSEFGCVMEPLGYLEP